MSLTGVIVEWIGTVVVPKGCLHIANGGSESPGGDLIVHTFTSLSPKCTGMVVVEECDAKSGFCPVVDSVEEGVVGELNPLQILQPQFPSTKLLLVCSNLTSFGSCRDSN